MTGARQPSALVLDFGGVVTRTLFETHDLTERALGLKPGTLTWRGPFDPDSDPLWRSMQDGAISERDYWLTRTRETGALIGRDWTRMVEFVSAARGNDLDRVIRPEVTALVAAAAAAGMPCAILSNELDLFYGSGIRDLPLLARFAVIVDATHTGILKPDPRSYALVVDGLGLAPADCLFVDDQTRNLDGARAAGLQTLHFDVRHPGASCHSARVRLGLQTDPEVHHDVA